MDNGSKRAVEKNTFQKHKKKKKERMSLFGKSSLVGG